jgi:hypothetical protein
MQGYVAQLSENDVLIFNMGLHFDETVTDSSNSIVSHSSAFYRDQLFNLVKDLGLTGYSHKRRCQNLSDPYLPFVVWRETLPQHFNSSNGHYPFLNTSDRNVCVPLTPSRRNGSELMPASSFSGEVSDRKCDPSCSPANWQNDIANSLMHELCVDTLPLWSEFSCLHNQHAVSYRDCSHLTETGNLIFINRVLVYIFRKKNIYVEVAKLEEFVVLNS